MIHSFHLMRARRVLPLALFPILLSLLTACQEDTPASDRLLLPPDVWEVSDIQGTIGFWDFDDVNLYFINVSVPGTIDSMVTGMVEDMPEAFQQVGLRVTFSGTYRVDGGNPRPMLGGQRIYSLDLSEIQMP